MSKKFKLLGAVEVCKVHLESSVYRSIQDHGMLRRFVNIP